MNGVDVTASAGANTFRDGFQIHGGCAELDSFVFRVPDEVLVAGTNLVAIRARDRGGASFANLRVIGKLP